jgi:hypothetical protein
MIMLIENFAHLRILIITNSLLSVVKGPAHFGADNVSAVSQNNTAQHYMSYHSTVQCSAVQYSTGTTVGKDRHQDKNPQLATLLLSVLVHNVCSDNDIMQHDISLGGLRQHHR